MTLQELATRAREDRLNTVVQFEDDEWTVFLVKSSSVIIAAEAAACGHEHAGIGKTLDQAITNLLENYR